MSFQSTELEIKEKKGDIKFSNSVICGMKILAYYYLHNLNFFRDEES